MTVRDSTDRSRERSYRATGSGGAAADARARDAGAHDAAARRREDAEYDASMRGEHRFPDSGQTASEQQARRERDQLRQQLRGNM